MRTPCILSLLFFWVSILLLPAQSLHFASYPCLTPDGSQVVFSYDGDLWQVAATGGTAYRLTAMEGTETRPRISPDGKWLAFTASPNGQSDVYLVPMGGGEIQRLTWHAAGDQVENWSWDSQSIYFHSTRSNRFSGYTVSIDGGTPQRLFDHYFHTVHNLAEHPDGRIFFNESWESINFLSRKGYKGAYNPDIKSYHPPTQEYKEYTDFIGKDLGATIDRTGNIFFVSTAYKGEYNLFTLTDKGPRRLTNFTSSIYHPAVSADGSQIVFEKDYQLFLYDVSSKKSSRIEIDLPQYRNLELEKDFNVSGNVSYYDVSPDQKKLCFVSRGELFISDIKGKFIRQIETRPDQRVVEAVWLKDSRRVLFSQTVGGYLNWFVISADGNGTERALTTDKQNNRSLSFNSDRSEAVYLSGRDEVRWMELENFESKTLVREELWALFNQTPSFSPDDQYVLFTAMRNFEQDIFVHHLATETTTNLTQTGLTETGPCWSPDGKYIYFVANRERPSYPYGLQNPDLYRLPLKKWQEPFKSDKVEELFAEDKEDDKDKDKEEETAEDSTETEKKTLVEMDTDQMWDRWERIGPGFGSQTSPYVVQKDHKTHVLFASNHEGTRNLWKLTMEPFESNKTEKIGGIQGSGTFIRTVKGKHYLLAQGNLHTLNLGSNKADKIDLDFTFRRQLRKEFDQMFDEVWANVEENFYDGEFHGVDWEAMRDRYRAYLPYVNRRAHLRRLVTDMLGELNTSHYGFYSNGPEENTFYSSSTLASGILFDKERPYTVKRIVAGTEADRDDIDIRPGDVLISVNGKSVEPSQNREYYFSTPSSDEELILGFSRAGTPFTQKIHPDYYGSVTNELYDEWEDQCRKTVNQQSGGKISYVHMKNMGGGELNRFRQYMTSEAGQGEGLIVDLRYNTGGNVHDEVLQFLAQKPYLKWKYRGGALTSQPNFHPANRPMVLLINEQSLSDAEMTATGFKQLGLGTIIGTETYRWIIFTSGKGLVDGSFYRLPSWGCYTLDGKDIELTGVAPDIYVKNNFKDRLEGKDPQLDKAISVIMEQLERGNSK